MSRVELNEHWTYWRDQVKIAAYRRALQQVITPDSVVLDLGCGTGLLGLLACEAGAKRVYAVDAGAIVSVAREIAGSTPYADRIVHIREMSTRVTLPELVDVVVADQIGGLAFDAGTNEFFADARARLAKPDAVFIPSAFTLRVAAVCAPSENDELAFWRSQPMGFDLSALAQVSANSVRQTSEQTTATYLGAAAVLAEMHSWSAEVIDRTTRLTIDRPGQMHGIMGMFVAQMADGVTMTNDPSSGTPMTTRWQDFLPIDHPLDVERGDAVSVTVRADPVSYQITWSVRVERDGRVLSKCVHSSALGVFLSKDDLGSGTEAPPTRLEPWQWALDAISGGAKPKDLAHGLGERFAHLFATERDCTRFAEDVWAAVR